jgi:Domain of unknown function DUF29
MGKQLNNIADAYKWSNETAQALRAGNLAAIDMDELIDEVESIASGLRRELAATLTDILEAILLLDYANANREEANIQLVHAQGQLQLLLSSCPSLKEALGGAIDKAYEWAKASVNDEYEIILPERCPVPLERVMEHPYDRLVAEGKLV